MPRSEFQMVVKTKLPDQSPEHTEVFEKDVDAELAEYGIASDLPADAPLEKKVEHLCKKYVNRFNASLRQGEYPREFVSCEVIEAELEEPDDEDLEDDSDDEDTEEVEADESE